ncbi:MAG: DUF6596 domain-containing protein [Pseudomonadota bacterium]
MTQACAQARAEDVARAAYGKLLAMLASRTGDIAAAEDALSEAFLAALRTWPTRGVPDSPEAWLLTAAKNRRIDQARKDARLVVTNEVPEMTDVFVPDLDETLDERLKLLFVCAHPAIDVAIRTPLMLQTVLGLEAEQIARAFLVSPTAMAQRLVRAKKKIKSAGIPFAIPDVASLPDRMASVLEAVYGAYAVDWLEGAGDLSHEAFFLSTILADLVPKDPEALGLTALIGFIEARRDARVHENMLVPVPDQDTDLWDMAMIERSANMLSRAATLGKTGRFQLEAAIQSVHAARSATGQTDWRALSQLYAGLVKLHPTIGAVVGRAAVTVEDAGPAEALKLLAKIEGPETDRYQPYHATHAHCLSRLGRIAEAAAAYDKAVSLCTDLPSRRWLAQKVAELRQNIS